MDSSVFFMIVVIAVATLFQKNLVDSREITRWGQDGSGSYFTTSKRKYGVPLVTRSTEVVFPNDFMDEKLTSHFTNQVILGITHFNDLEDTDCKPELEITKGGVNQQFATLSIKSKRGCGIDSTVGFTTTRV